MCVSGVQHAVVRIVRDKMQQTEPFTNPQELQAFVSKLYVYLVEEMHIAVNEVTHTHTHTHNHNYTVTHSINILHIYVHFKLSSSPDFFR